MLAACEMVIVGYKSGGGNCSFAKFYLRRNEAELPDDEVYSRVCTFIAKGYTQRRIARDCHLSAQTVSSYTNRYRRKRGWKKVERQLVAWMDKHTAKNCNKDQNRSLL